MNGYYDEGWNARVMNQPWDATKSRDWRDGWMDCEHAIKAGIPVGLAS